MKWISKLEMEREISELLSDRDVCKIAPTPGGGGGVVRYISDGDVRMRRNC